MRRRARRHWNRWRRSVRSRSRFDVAWKPGTRLVAAGPVASKRPLGDGVFLEEGF